MSATLSIPEVKTPRRRVRILAVIVLPVLVALLCAVAWAWWIAHSALPQVDGTIVVPGISAKVRVIRNEQGVPTIEAATPEDLFFAQGYVTAQDRLWQMDIMRRAAGGELSEIVGADTVKLDREQRILGLRGAAETSEKSISARDHAYFGAYARGVNAFIDSSQHRLPLEFRLLKYRPRPWTITDSLLIGARMVQDLNHYSYAKALTREKILAQLGPQLTADLYINSSWHDRPPTDLRRSMDKEPATSNGDDDDDEEENDVDTDGTSTKITWSQPSAIEPPALEPLIWLQAMEMESFRAGSNDWVISGQHTTTGKPLLSNDMHLDHQMPNLWFEAHLKSGNFDVVGVTLPGVPFVIVGHNQRIGWGFTNVGPTVEDDYIEEFNAQGQYKTPKGWLDPQHRQEIIRVKGQPEVVFDVVTTRHGPIITDLIPGETRKIALRWTLYDGMAIGLFDVDAAQNWEDFRRAFSAFAAPGQNVVYADVDGNIGYQATGHIPIRASGDGSLPVRGSDDDHEWTGYIGYDDMPHIYNPSTGIIATANGRISPNGYKYSISTEWDAPWRTDRIYRVLESGKKFGPADMLTLQMDASSAFDHFCADKFVYALDHAAKVSARARKAADILRDWDGRMSADSAAPTIETKARQQLFRLLLEPKLGAGEQSPATEGSSSSQSGALTWKSYRWEMSTVWLENVLTKQPARWLPSDYSDYGALLAAAVEDAVNEKGAPPNLAQWRWGENYPVEIDHPVLSKLPLIGGLTGPGWHPLNGNNYTVKAVGRHFGSSERLTWNFADFDSSTLNLVTGESGVFLSPNYMDQWNAWYGGTTFTLPFSAAAVESHRMHEVTLAPR
jgi:penicillin G amidase